MKVERVDHTAIVVADMEEAIERWGRLTGATVRDRQEVPHQRVEVAFLEAGGTLLELIHPLNDQSGVARFLSRRGEALHHLGLAVDDLPAALEELAAEGAELIDREPRAGVHGDIAFIHPRSTGGVLVELVEQRSSAGED
ncbi:MAG TPA: methylmalonyl-CoA epimerase [Chloroflexota bacterium]|nr:methylmalonyl-CoA epimerase [Chloroflexota bacterium]